MISLDRLCHWTWNSALPLAASVRLGTMHPAAFCIGWIAALTPAHSHIDHGIEWTKKQIADLTPTTQKIGASVVAIAYIAGRRDASAVAALVMGLWQGTWAIKAAKKEKSLQQDQSSHRLKLCRNLFLCALTINELRSRSLLTGVGLVLVSSSAAPVVRKAVTKLDETAIWIVKDSRRIALVALPAIIFLPYVAIGWFFYLGAKTGIIALDHLRRFEANSHATPWYGLGVQQVMADCLEPWMGAFCGMHC